MDHDYQVYAAEARVAALDAAVRPFVDSYEFRSDEIDHTPTDSERALLEDVLHGFIAEHWTAPPPPAGSDGLVARLSAAIDLGKRTGAAGKAPTNIYVLAEEALAALAPTPPVAPRG